MHNSGSRYLALVALALGACGGPAASTDAGDARGDTLATSDTRISTDVAVPDGEAPVDEGPALDGAPSADEGPAPDDASVTPDEAPTIDAPTIDAPMIDARPQPDAVTPPGDAPAPGDAASDAPVTDAPVTDAPEGECEPFGRFPAPTNVFTIPAPARGGTEIYYPDVQRSFPAVNWATLDRLYVPAGNYTLLNLGNLPVRTAARPLVITNIGGQVNITVPVGSRQGYIWAMGGGANWVLTGRYDPMARTGDERFPGHRCGRYANTQNSYGFSSDGHFVNGGHMGIGVTEANSFEIEFIEVKRSGFAGVRLLNRPRADGTFTPMDNVRFHDNYIHDTKSEGLYFGWTGDPPSVQLSRLQVYNNRILRTGTETAQLQNLGDGTEVHHNVFAFGAIDWRAAFGAFQDNGSQTNVREGTIRFHHNVIMGGAGTLVNYFSAPETGDGARTVTYADNYFADTLSLGIYLGGTATAGSRFAFERNAFRGMDFGYNMISPTATDPNVVLRVGNTITAPVELTQNRWEGSRALIARLTGGEGTVGNVTARGNTNGSVPVYSFAASGLPAGTRTRSLEMWAATATLHPMMPMVRYEAGALVMYDGDLYQCTAANTNAPPPMNPAMWRRLPAPADDMRPAAGNTYAGVGLLPRSP